MRWFLGLALTAMVVQGQTEVCSFGEETFLEYATAAPAERLKNRIEECALTFCWSKTYEADLRGALRANPSTRGSLNDLSEAARLKVQKNAQCRVSAPAAPSTPGPASIEKKWIPAGSFLMGCSPGDTCDDDEKPQKRVEIARGFWMAATETTQVDYERVMKGNPSHFRGPKLPVERVTHEEAKYFCTGVGGRLPTAGEWEYAARAGTLDARYAPPEVAAWYDGNSGSKTHEVGTKLANAWGLYDMLGNVWEWTSTRYSKNSIELRGGSWGDNSRYVRASDRYWDHPSVRFDSIGFRCLWEMPR